MDARPQVVGRSSNQSLDLEVKCIMMIIFQRRMIYLPYFPPGSRTQEFDENDAQLQGIKALKLSFPPTNRSPRLDGLLLSSTSKTQPCPDGLIFYLQGNAGNTLARVPVFREILSASNKSLAVFALSPRGYWSSGGPLPFPFTPLTRPSYRFNQRGIIHDYERSLFGLVQRPELDGLPIWLMGHSLGAAVAVQLIAGLESSMIGRSRIAGLILENPLPSIRRMVKVLYPSKWLPYHHLGVFVRDPWDTIAPFQRLQVPFCSSGTDSLACKHRQPAGLLSRIPLMFIQSERDELVPPHLTRFIYDQAILSRESTHSENPLLEPDELVTEFITIPYALHDNAYSKPRYRLKIGEFLHKTMSIGK